MKRNLTVQLEEGVITGAKILAAKRGMSVSAVVAQEIGRLVASEERYDEAMRRARKAMGDAVPRGGRGWKRDDLYEQG